MINVVKKFFGELCGTLKYLVDSSLQTGVFPDLMKIAIVSPVFKTGDTADISNYRPISVLPQFSQILERVMYSRLYKHLLIRKYYNHKKFAFRTGHLQNVQLLSLQIRYTNYLITTTTMLAFLSTFRRRLIKLIIQYFWKSLRSMELQL